MKRISMILGLMTLLVACYKWSPNWKDTKFRNQFVGKWRIDSASFFVPSITPVGDTIRVVDSQYTIYAKPGDYLEILFTKDQVNKNVTCTGRFLDSIFSYDVQGFDDKGSEMLAFTYCLTCQPSEVFQKYIRGGRYIKRHEGKSLVIGSRFYMNNNFQKEYYQNTHLTKLE